MEIHKYRDINNEITNELTNERNPSRKPGINKYTPTEIQTNEETPT